MGQCIHCKEVVYDDDLALHALCCKNNPNYKLNQFYANKNKEVKQVVTEKKTKTSFQKVKRRIMNFLDDVEKLPEDEQEILAQKVNKLLDRTVLTQGNKDMLFNNLMTMMLQNVDAFKVDE